jgi:DNA-binding transcriptional MerR regulator
MAENVEPIALPQPKAAAALGVTVRTLRRWELRGLITATRPVPGGAKLYPVDKLKELAGR